MCCEGDVVASVTHLFDLALSDDSELTDDDKETLLEVRCVSLVMFDPT